MSEINVVQRTQQIIVDPASGTVAVINAGAIGSTGPPGADGEGGSGDGFIVAQQSLDGQDGNPMIYNLDSESFDDSDHWWASLSDEGGIRVGNYDQESSGNYEAVDHTPNSIVFRSRGHSTYPYGEEADYPEDWDTLYPNSDIPGVTELYSTYDRVASRLLQFTDQYAYGGSYIHEPTQGPSAAITASQGHTENPGAPVKTQHLGRIATATLVIAAKDAMYPGDADFVCGGEYGDDADTLAAALDFIQNWSGDWRNPWPVRLIFTEGHFDFQQDGYTGGGAIWEKCTFEGQGLATIVDNAEFTLLDYATLKNMVIRHTLTEVSPTPYGIRIDGDHTTIEGLWIIAGDDDRFGEDCGPGPGICAIQGDNLDRVIIKNNTIIGLNCSGGIIAGDFPNSQIVGNRIIGCQGNYGIYADDDSHLLISNNVLIRDAPDGYGDEDYYPEYGNIFETAEIGHDSYQATILGNDLGLAGHIRNFEAQFCRRDDIVRFTTKIKFADTVENTEMIIDLHPFVFDSEVSPASVAYLSLTPTVTVTKLATSGGLIPSGDAAIKGWTIVEERFREYLLTELKMVFTGVDSETEFFVHVEGFGRYATVSV